MSDLKTVFFASQLICSCPPGPIELCHEKNSFGFLTRADTNQPVLSQMKAKSLKCLERNFYADQLCSHYLTDLCLGFAFSCVTHFCYFESTGHLRYLEIKGNGETTSSFAKFEISKLSPANVLRKSQLFHILGLSGSPFHHVYHIDSDFKGPDT